MRGGRRHPWRKRQKGWLDEQGLAMRKGIVSGPSFAACGRCGAAGWNTAYASLQHAPKCLEAERAANTKITAVDAKRGTITIE